MFKKFTFIVLAVFMANLATSQTTEELQQMLADKSAALADAQAQVGALEGEIAGIKGQLVVYPTWTTGAAGTIGANFSQFNQWLGRANPNTSLGSFGFSGGAFANRDDEKHFWRNSLNLNVAKTKLVTDTDNQALKDSTGYFSGCFSPIEL